MFGDESITKIGQNIKYDLSILLNYGLEIKGPLFDTMMAHYLIQPEMLKEGVVLIDAGTSDLDSGIVGDVDFESVNSIAGFISPVPGGVGPVTVAQLLKNVLKVAKLKSS